MAAGDTTGGREKAAAEAGCVPFVVAESILGEVDEMLGALVLHGEDHRHAVHPLHGVGSEFALLAVQHERSLAMVAQAPALPVCKTVAVRRCELLLHPLPGIVKGNLLLILPDALDNDGVHDQALWEKKTRSVVN